jgi:hypothetical protein
LNGEIPASAAHDFEFIRKHSTGARGFELDGYREQPIPTSLPQDLVDPLPLCQGIPRPKSCRLGKPALVQETEQIEEIALAAHVGSDQNIQWSQRKINVSQASEIPRADSRNHKDTETMIPRSGPAR